MAVLLLVAPTADARRFYPDDPIWREPKPLPVGDVVKMKIDALYDFFFESIRQERRPPAPAQAINTLGGVADSAWFTNRHGARRMSREELRAGAGISDRPVGPFKLVGAKTDGITPGFRMKDAQGRLYFVKPDPVSNPEMATGSDVVVSRFFHAIGYYTPQNYILNLKQEELRFAPEATVEGLNGKPRPLGQRDLDKIFRNVPYRSDGSVRVVASLGVQGTPIGPFRYEGVRTDDPNDLAPHQHRRDLRGLSVFCAWLNHTDAKAQNSLDTIIQEDGVRFIRHYLIDFGSALGSDSDMPKNARFGHEYVIPHGRDALGKIVGAGLISPRWERAEYPDDKAVGRFEAEVFDPEKWKSNYPNPAFLSALPDDQYWAAKIVIAFRDEDIRAIVESGEFTDPATVDYLTRTLAARRDKIGRAYFGKVLPLDDFVVRDRELHYTNLAVNYKFDPARPLEVSWTLFDNDKETHTPIAGASGFRLPGEAVSRGPGIYFAAKIVDPTRPKQTVTVYLCTESSGVRVVGLDRTW